MLRNARHALTHIYEVAILSALFADFLKGKNVEIYFRTEESRGGHTISGVVSRWSVAFTIALKALCAFIENALVPIVDCSQVKSKYIRTY